MAGMKMPGKCIEAVRVISRVKLLKFLLSTVLIFSKIFTSMKTPPLQPSVSTIPLGKPSRPPPFFHILGYFRRRTLDTIRLERRPPLIKNLEDY